MAPALLAILRVAQPGPRAAENVSKATVSLGIVLTLAVGATMRVKGHSDGQVCEPTRVARLDGEHKSCGNNATIGTGETELVLTIENLRRFFIDLLADAKESEVDVLAVEEPTVELAVMTALPKVLMAATRIWPELDRDWNNKGLLVDLEAQLNRQLQKAQVHGFLQSVSGKGGLRRRKHYMLALVLALTV